MALVTDLVEPMEMIGYVRGVQIELERNTFTLSQYLPNNQVDEIEWRVTTANLRDEDAAPLRQWDTEAPVGGRQGAQRLYGELPPISKKIPLGEEQRLRARALLRGDGDTTEIVNGVFNDAERMTRAVLARMELLRGEAIQTGQNVINENGVVQTVSWGRKGAHTVSAAIKWDQATADPVADMRAWVQTYIDTNGVAPAFALTSTQVITQLMLNQKIRELATTAVLGAPSLVTVDTVMAVFAAFGLPPLVAYDTTVRLSGTSTRVTNVKMLTLMPPAVEPLGETRWGPTAESMVLAAGNFVPVADAPGIVATIMATDDPPTTWTKATGVGLPLLPNPDLTFTATVLT